MLGKKKKIKKITTHHCKNGKSRCGALAAAHQPRDPTPELTRLLGAKNKSLYNLGGGGGGGGNSEHFVSVPKGDPNPKAPALASNLSALEPSRLLFAVP